MGYRQIASQDISGVFGLGGAATLAESYGEDAGGVCRKTTGSDSSANTVYGNFAGSGITTGTSNTAVGYATLGAIGSTVGATAVGWNALNNATVISDAFGYKAGYTITSNQANVSIGAYSMSSGVAAAGTGNNTAVGYSAMMWADGSVNTNTAVGAAALVGSGGTHMTGNSNVAVGYQAGALISSGVGNVIIGTNAEPQNPTDTKSIVIGTSATGFGSNSISIANVIAATGTGTPSTSVTSTAGAFSAGGAMTSNTPAGGVGYATGAGGTVTQGTSRTTGVTINKVTGAITLFAFAPVVGTLYSFTVTNSSVAATDCVVLSVKSATNNYLAYVSAVGAGSFQVTTVSQSGVSSDSPVINFAVIKGVTS